MVRLSFLSIASRGANLGYYLGDYNTILRLVGILSYGKIAKRLCDRAIDNVDSVQNLRKAVYE